MDFCYWGVSEDWIIIFFYLGVFCSETGSGQLFYWRNRVDFCVKFLHAHVFTMWLWNVDSAYKMGKQMCKKRIKHCQRHNGPRILSPKLELSLKAETNANSNLAL